MVLFNFELTAGSINIRHSGSVRGGKTKVLIRTIISIVFFFSQVYCHMESDNVWTLLGRFSMEDGENWMKDSGEWWYDKNVLAGETADPLSNKDMISPAFWLVSGNEIKITRNDDPQHIALLQTTSDCLGGQTFRLKITSYGDFRNGTTSGNNRCLGNCTVQFGGQYETTQGFGKAKCNGTILSGDKIGFWCDRAKSWGGAVVMIGGGGNGICGLTSHGLGVTRAYKPSFKNGKRPERDFGNSPSPSDYTRDYSLNLWIL